MTGTDEVGGAYRTRQTDEMSDRAIAQILATASHELRAPLAGIVGLTELLIRSETTDDQRHLIETIHGSCHALIRLVEDLLDHSVVAAGGVRFSHTPFDLHRTMREVRDLLHPSRAERPVEMAVIYDAALPAAIMGDAGRIRQILINLVGNAVKFTDTGSIRIRAEGLPGTTERFRLTVEDTGIGIAPDMTLHIFEAFTKAGDAMSDGRGLGLAISERLALAMGGRIWVRSTPGQGSVFGVDLPLEPATMAVPVAAPPPPAPLLSPPPVPLGVPPPDPSLDPSADPPPPASPLGLRQMRVIVAEDNRTSRLLMAKLIRKLDIELMLAADGLATIDAFRASRPDLMFLDLSMPGLDGIEAIRRIRARETAEGLPRIPAIALTAHSAGDILREAIEAGFDRCLTKPVRRDVLIDTIRAARPPECRPVDSDAAVATVD